MTKGLDGRFACNCLRLRRASEAITKVYNQHLEPAGITISQYSLLSSIARIEPVNVSELAAHIRLDRTTLVRNLKPLEQAGLIADISKKGARNRQLTVSENGRKTLEKATPLWIEAQENLEHHLGLAELSTLNSLLSRIEDLGP